MKIVLWCGSLTAIMFNVRRLRANRSDLVVRVRACALHLLAFVD